MYVWAAIRAFSLGSRSAKNEGLQTGEFFSALPRYLDACVWAVLSRI